MTYVPLRKRSLLARVIRTPRLFYAHFKAMRVIGGCGVLQAAKAAVLLTCTIYQVPQ